MLAGQRSLQERIAVMIVGILKEIKAEENRVSMTPAGVEVMKQNGHTVLVEKNAGIRSGFEDTAYVKAGAEIIDDAKEIFQRSELILRVKEPFLPSMLSCRKIRSISPIFTWLHQNK